MAWAAFQKSNWTRAAGPQKAIQYFPASSNGTATGNITFTAGQVKSLTLTAAFMFKGNGMMEAYIPEQGGSSSGFGGGQTAAAAGVCIENAYLIGAAPASSSYAAGNHPLIIVQISSGAAYTTAAAGFDIVCMQS
jgi:hypothetical protein